MDYCVMIHKTLQGASHYQSASPGTTTSLKMPVRCAGTFINSHFFVVAGTMDYPFGSLMSLNICSQMNTHY